MHLASPLKIEGLIHDLQETLQNMGLLNKVYKLLVWVFVYLVLKVFFLSYKNPRRFLIYQENGHFWYSWFSNIKYCGHCMNEGERRELKYNGHNIWECTNCNKQFSPHDER